MPDREKAAMRRLRSELREKDLQIAKLKGFVHYARGFILAHWPNNAQHFTDRASAVLPYNERF